MRPPLPHHESSERNEHDERFAGIDGDAEGDLPPLLAEVRIFVVPGKLDLREVYEKVDALGAERVIEPDAARVVVTGLRGAPRLERALGRDLHERTIVSAAYVDAVYDIARKAGPKWQEGDVPSLPDMTPYLLRFRRPSVEVVEPPDASSKNVSPLPAKRTHGRSDSGGSKGGQNEADEPERKRRRPAKEDHAEPQPKPKQVKSKRDVETSDSRDQKESDRGEEEDPDVERVLSQDEKDEAALIGPRVGPLEDVRPYPADINFGSIPRMAVLRPSPLRCVNQDIIEAIKPIYSEREFDEGQQINSNVLSYRRSMAILKSVPRRIRSGSEAQTLVDVGGKVANRIDEYLATGRIAESGSIKSSERYKALRLFSSVFTIGTHTAVQLWDAGCRTLDDVLQHYDWTPPTTAREERRARKRRMEGTMTKPEIVHAWIKLRGELDEQISRKDVAAISSLVREHLRALRGDTQQVIAGGFRRGKQDTSDVDVIFTAGLYKSHSFYPDSTNPHPHPNLHPSQSQTDTASTLDPDTDVFGTSPDAADGLLFRLVRRLCRLGIITHVLQLTQRSRVGPLHSSGANFDNLDKAFVILKIGGKHRRVDLICSPRARYAAAVLSWSGSMMFERDLRRYAEDRGLKFRAGLIDPQTQREINFATEREIFAYLDLPYVPPPLRNADG